MKYIFAIFRIGSEKVSDPQEKRRIILSNQLAVMFISGVVMMIFPLTIIEQARDPGLLAAVGVMIIAFSTGFWLNARRHFQLMRLTLFATANFGVLLSSFLIGSQNATELFFLPLAAVPILFISPQQRIGLYAMSLLSIALLVATMPIKRNFEPIVYISPLAVELGGYLFYLLPSLGMILALLWAHNGNARLQTDLETEKRKSDRLLLNILPPAIAGRLKAGERLIADRHEHSTVLFADLVGFTPLAKSMPAVEIVGLLNEIFSGFDILCEIHSLEKIKTIGDSYMAVAGVPSPDANHAQSAANMALEMKQILDTVAATRQLKIGLRIGLHSGPIVAGIIGDKKFVYDLWGDTVNIASRMESHGLPGTIHISEDVATMLGATYTLEPRGEIEIKGRGEMRTFLLRGKKS